MSSTWPTAFDDIEPTSDRDAPSLASVLNQLQQVLGITGSFNFAKLTDPSLEDVIRQNVFNPSVPPNAAVPLNNQRLLNVGTPLASTDGATALGSLIGATYYEPSIALYSTGTTTGAAIDATNLTVSFTAISSAVLVELSAGAAVAVGTGLLGWTLYTHGTLTQQGYWVIVVKEPSSSGIGLLSTCQIRVTGLNPGTTYNWDWGWATTAGTGEMGLGCSQSATLGSTNLGPAIMRVFAA